MVGFGMSKISDKSKGDNARWAADTASIICNTRVIEETRAIIVVF